MRLRIAIAAMAALGAVMFTAVGLYLRYGADMPGGVAVLPAGVPTTVTRSGQPFSFSMLETPKPLPELKFVNGEGREMTLTSFDGQVVLLNIWATWCVPCREEMPALDRLQARLGGPAFRVVPLSIDRGGLPAVQAFYRELGLKTLGIYVDRTGTVARQLGAVGLPTTLLVDRDGREIGRKVGPAECDSSEVVQILQRYLKPRTVDPQSMPEGEP
jgi:thiol-disulfide isomerase/thioredoxin